MNDKRTLSLAEFYEELSRDPDLRRLGEYRVECKKEKAVFPIELNLEGKEIKLGNGDFREAFTAFSKTKAKGIDLGDSVFTDLYLDYIEVEDLNFSNSKASRLYFDFATVNNCNFGSFIAPEVYFDSAEIDTVKVENLQTGIMYFGKLKVKNLDLDEIKSRVYRVAIDNGGFNPFSEHEDLIIREKTETDKEDVIMLTVDDLMKEIESDPDLRRLGKYSVVPNADSNLLHFNWDCEGKDIKLGSGDFSRLEISFGHTIANSIDFNNSVFSKLDLGSLQVRRLDFSNSKAPFLYFHASNIGECYFADFQGYKINFDGAKIKTIFGERAITESVHLDYLSADQFNINSLQAQELSLGKSQLREVYLSVGAGIQKMYFDESRLELLNLHEGKLSVVDFGNSEVTRAMINKATIDIIRCEELIAETMFFGNDGKNHVGTLEFGDSKGIGHLELEKLLQAGIAQEDRRETFGELKFGKLI